MLCLRTNIMQTLSALLLFVSVASAFAFSSHGRPRRGAPETGAGAGATAGSFATSGAFGNGYGGGAGGAGGFAFPGPTAYGGPSAFESAFRSYFDQMESLLAAQQAHAQALSNRHWTDWRGSPSRQPGPAAARPAAAAPSFGGGQGFGFGQSFGQGFGQSFGPGFGFGHGHGHAPGGAGAFSSPNYYHYSGPPSASHAHSAFSFLPHRFNAASANAIPGNSVDGGQAASASQYAGSFSGGHGPGAGFGFGSGSGGVPGGVGAGAGAGQGAGGHGFSGSGLGGAAQGAQAALAVNNRGGFGQAQLFPDPNLSSRISGDIAPLSGGSFGVFSSSSSSSHSDPSGKTHTFKQASVGVNDNGKITTFSVKDP